MGEVPGFEVSKMLLSWAPRWFPERMFSAENVRRVGERFSWWLTGATMSAAHSSELCNSCNVANGRLRAPGLAHPRISSISRSQDCTCLPLAASAESETEVSASLCHAQCPPGQLS